MQNRKYWRGGDFWKWGGRWGIKIFGCLPLWLICFKIESYWSTTLILWVFVWEVYLCELCLGLFQSMGGSSPPSPRCRGGSPPSSPRCRPHSGPVEIPSYLFKVGHQRIASVAHQKRKEMQSGSRLCNIFAIVVQHFAIAWTFTEGQKTPSRALPHTRPNCKKISSLAYYILFASGDLHLVMTVYIWFISLIN